MKHAQTQVFFRTVLGLILIAMIFPGIGESAQLITQTPAPPTQTPSPTATAPGGSHYLVVNSLPACSEALVISVTGSTVPYSNIDVYVVDIETSTSRHVYQWTNSSEFSVPITLFDDTLNGITVRSCGDVYPPPCTTISYVSRPDLIVDTGDCSTTTPTATLTATPTRTPTRTPTPTPYGHFNGDVRTTVLHAHSGLPIEGAEVSAYSLTQGSCTTDETGTCVTTLLMDELGFVTIIVESEGYSPFNGTFAVQPGGLDVTIELYPLGTPTPVISATAVPPTSTPTVDPTRTPPEEPTATPAGAPCDFPGVSLKMPAHEFKGGDPCWLDAIVCNPTEYTWDTFRLLVLLDIYNQYFFAPSWSQDIDWLDEEFPPGETTIRLFEFAWPAGLGETSWFRFYAGVCTDDMTQLIGGIGYWEFRGI